MHGLNTYDYGARQHDPILGRWDRIDPLCEKYYNVSPYVYCVNNPVMFIDPNGMKWEDPQEAERLKKGIEKRIESVNRDVIKLCEKMFRSGNDISQDEFNKLSNQLKGYNEMLKNLNESINDINLLGNDENIYAFSKTEGGIHNVRKGDDGKVYIETSSDAMSIHEITHVRQDLEHGGLKFSKKNYLIYYNNTVSTKFASETEAYRKQYSFDGSFPGNTKGYGIFGINNQSISEIRDENGRIIYTVK